ncbi:MAG: (2Fe-2S) ferredoxin domain-containing protein, partial [Dehalococcoidia bacterium]
MVKVKSLIDLEIIRHKIISRRNADRPCVSICSSGCRTVRSEETVAAFIKEIAEKGLQDQVDVRRTGCHGFCEQGPIVVITPQQICYMKVSSDRVPEIVSQTLI